jgi:hypothetical protein
MRLARHLRGRREPIRRAAQPVYEQLEQRRLLCSTSHWYLPPAPEWSDAIEQESRASRNGPEGGPDAIDIVWANRNTFSGTDDNMFDDVFGASTAAAQLVVDAAISAWENVITSFNRGDGSNTLQVNITMAPGVGGFGGAGGPAAAAPADGLPRTGSITINAGTMTPDPNDNNGWFLDATPFQYEEFLGSILKSILGQSNERSRRRALLRRVF